MAVSMRTKYMNEEKPTDFEKITLEFNLIYNEVLAFSKEKDDKNAQQRYLQLYNLYLKICNEGLKKKEQVIIDKRMEDASSLVDSKRKFLLLKNKKI